jgi:hypothetical protein
MIPFTRSHLNSRSPKHPMHPSVYLKSIFEIDAALQSIRAGAEPKLNDWIALADMVGVMDSLKQQGAIRDDDHLITDAVNTLAESSTRAGQGKAIRLDGKGILAVAALMQDYTTCCEQLPERTIKSAINHAFEIQTQLKTKERKAREAQEVATA